MLGILCTRSTFSELVVKYKSSVLLFHTLQLTFILARISQQGKVMKINIGLLETVACIKLQNVLAPALSRT